MIFIQKFFTNSLLIILSIFIVYFSYLSEVNAINNVDWLLLKENNYGKQWLDIGSIKRIKKNEVSVLTKFYKDTDQSKNKGETFLYVMRINCDNNQFKDTSINGFPKLNAQWENSNNDELIDMVIEKSCIEANLR